MGQSLSIGLDVVLQRNRDDAVLHSNFRTVIVADKVWSVLAKQIMPQQWVHTSPTVWVALYTSYTATITDLMLPVRPDNRLYWAAIGALRAGKPAPKKTGGALHRVAAPWYTRHKLRNHPAEHTMQHLDDWLDHLDRRGKSHHTIDAYRRAVEHFIDWNRQTYGTDTFRPDRVLP